MDWNRGRTSGGRGVGGGLHLALCERDQIFHEGQAGADLGLEQQQIKLGLHEVFQDVNKLGVEVLEELAVGLDDLWRRVNLIR